ncbi:MAG: hypothetical protein WAM22_11800 [Nitrososphaeraceae archaeon]
MTHIKDMTYLIRDLMSSLMLSHGSLTIPLFIGLVLTSTVIASITINPVQAETGKGTDVFKVIMTIFGVEESKGDVVAIVTAKNEVAKMKLFDALGPEVVPINASEGGGHFIEYVATFPNVTVNSGDEYKVCIATVKNLELICKIGNNSPAARPEFVDLSLNASSSSGSEQVTAEEGDSVDENDEEGDSGDDDNTDTTGEGEEDNVSPGIPPIG